MPGPPSRGRCTRRTEHGAGTLPVASGRPTPFGDVTCRDLDHPRFSPCIRVRISLCGDCLEPLFPAGNLRTTPPHRRPFAAVRSPRLVRAPRAPAGRCRLPRGASRSRAGNRCQESRFHGRCQTAYIYISRVLSRARVGVYGGVRIRGGSRRPHQPRRNPGAGTEPTFGNPVRTADAEPPIYTSRASSCACAMGVYGGVRCRDGTLRNRVGVARQAEPHWRLTSRLNRMARG